MTDEVTRKAIVDDYQIYAAMRRETPEPAKPAESPEARADTVAFVQEWLMNADYDPTQFDRDFAAAIDARAASTARPTERGAVEAMQLARPIVEADLEAAKEQGDADWEGMSFTALEAIDAALAQPATDQAAEVEKLREALGWALSEIEGRTRYENPQQRQNCIDIANDALASSSKESGR